MLGLFLAASTLGALLQRSLWGQVGTRVLVYPDRLVCVRKGRAVDYRWEDISAFYCRAVNQYISHLVIDQNYVESQYEYRFLHRDGHRFDFSEKLHRERATPIASFVEHGLCERQLGQLREQLAKERAPIPFGPLTLDPDGIRCGRSLLPWEQVDYVWAEEGKVYIRKKEKLLKWCSVKAEKIPNCCLFLALAKERCEQG